MMNIRFAPFALLLTSSSFLACAHSAQTGDPLPSKPTEVVFIGTFHNMHLTMPNYHPDTMRWLLALSKPDVLAVESRPQDLAAEDGGQAPGDIRDIVIPWARRNNVPVVPIDWWQDGSRQQHEALMEELSATAEGRQKLDQVPDEGDVHRDRFPQLDEMTVAYIHSDEFARKDHEVREACTKVLGEGPGNLFWNQRTEQMYRLLHAALEQHPGRRVVVVTGAAHRGDLEQRVRTSSKATVVPLMNLVADAQPPRYRGDEGGATEIKRMVLALVQGRKASRNPDKVNLPFVDQVLEVSSANETTQRKLSTVLAYARAERFYLGRDYERALQGFLSTAEGNVDDEMFGMSVRQVSRLRAANMLDLLGRHDQARETYASLKSAGEPIADLAAKYQQSPYTRATGQ